MSLEAQYRAIYELFYKFWVRDAYLQGKFREFKGLTERENEEVANAVGGRLEFVAGLHAGDIGANWYMPRFPASWTALQVALDRDSKQLAGRFTDTDEFELRVNDDFDGRALAAWVQRLADTKPRKPPNKPKPAPPLANAPWLPELLRYERMIAGHWPDDTSPRVETFEWDVGGIHDALLEKQLFPMDEEPAPLNLLLHRDEAGVTELALDHDQARVMRKLLARADLKDEPPKLVAKCRRALNRLLADGS
jgi:hypothetical protein